MLNGLGQKLEMANGKQLMDRCVVMGVASVRAFEFTNSEVYICVSERR